MFKWRTCPSLLVALVCALAQTPEPGACTAGSTTSDTRWAYTCVGPDFHWIRFPNDPGAGSLDVSGAPVGTVDTPADSAGYLAGSVAFTGWALSPSEIPTVKLYREAVEGEPRNTLVYIGTATFVSQARPDVASAYPQYPYSDRAGWGYLMLSNTLPSGGHGATRGNGTYRVTAIATDSAGHATRLGSRTISVDNLHSPAPWGTIDSPAPGETVSGAYNNFGWVLAASPHAIKSDGSGITVFIDGMPVGHATYGGHRPDVELLFPGLYNSGGAGAFFSLDTTRLSNGRHSIAWSVSDDAGTHAGIGSRYFFVQN